MTTGTKLEVGQLYISVEDEQRFPDRKRKIEVKSTSQDSSGRVEVLSINEGTGKNRKMKLLASRLLGKYYRLSLSSSVPAALRAAGAKKSTKKHPSEKSEDAAAEIAEAPPSLPTLEARWIEGQDGRPGEWLYFHGEKCVVVADKNLRRRLVAKAKKEHKA